jgi:NAD(P)-dependent dehydrogenase (short-subunit alcohol dehydrogenase family)
MFATEGAMVTVCDINDGRAIAQQIEVQGGQAIAVPTDVSNAESMSAAVDATLTAYGALDVLVCCAGVWFISSEGLIEGKTDAPAELLTEDIWTRTIDVNLKGTYLACRYAIPHLRRSSAASIVTVASVAALRVGNGASDAYTASKGGVLAMTRTLAVEHAPQGIRVNCLCPGPTDTAMAQTLSEERRRSFAQEVPMGRLGSPEELARAALFLASDESSFMTGSMLVVDGGYSAK